MTNASSDKEARVAPLLSAERQAKAKEYTRINRRLAVIEAILVSLALGWLIIGGWGESIVRTFGLPDVPAAVVYFGIIYIGYRVLFWPFGYYRGYVLSHRYGLSNQDPGGWASDYIKSSALILALGAGAVAAVYWFISIQPQLWWLIAWGMMIIISSALSYLAPVVLVPLFFRMKPMAETDTKERLEGLAKKAGVNIAGVYTIEFGAKTSAANAALMGTGKTRRIAISDTLLAGFTPEETEVVVAHELGHQKNRDFGRLFIFQSIVLLLCFWLTDIVTGSLAEPLGFAGIGDAAAMPLFVAALLAMSVLVTPALNTFSRSRERAADDFSLRLTGQPEAFISMIAKLTDQNLVEAEPGRWTERLLNDHPSYKSRVEHARRYLKPEDRTPEQKL